jgi:hypothetical protein
MCIDEGGPYPIKKIDQSQSSGDVFSEDFFNSIICNFVEAAQTTINQFIVLETISVG